MLCPHCRELIQDGAIYCKHCHRRVERTLWPLLLALAGGLLLVAGGLYLVLRTPKPPEAQVAEGTPSRQGEPTPPNPTPPVPVPAKVETNGKPKEEKLNMEALKAAVLRIEWEESVGSGFLISEDGKAVTCAHVVGTAKSVSVRFQDGTSGRASVVQTNKEGDLALLQIESVRKFPYIELGDSTLLTAGQEVTVLGYQLGLDTQVLTRGVVSAVPIYLPIVDIPLIQIDASINPGNSGGPVLDLAGKAVGVVAAKLLGADAMNWAVPVNYASRLAIPQAANLDSRTFISWRLDAKAKRGVAPKTGSETGRCTRR